MRRRRAGAARTRRLAGRAAALGLALVPAAAAGGPLPDPIRAMIAAAVRTGDPTTVAAVVAMAKQTAPGNAGEIDALASGPRPPAAVALRQAVVAVQTPAAWKGEVEVGGARSTGAARTLRLYGGVELSRKVADWTHKLTARADYQETGGATTTERVVLAYQPQMRIDPVFYAYGLGQYEHDRSLGYRDRYTVGAGVGVSGVHTPALNISFDAGPAFRRTVFYEAPIAETFAGRAAVNARWSPTPRIAVLQQVAVYLEKDNATAQATTSMDAQLYGPLKARISHSVHYERDSVFDRKVHDSTSRASLIYRF